MHERFFEAYVDCPLDKLAERDVKGLYKKALAGEIKNFTGVSDPYEAPLNPELTLNSEPRNAASKASRTCSRPRSTQLYQPPGSEHDEQRRQAMRSPRTAAASWST